MPQWCWGTPQFLCAVGALSVHDFLFLGGSNLCVLETTVPLFVSIGPAHCWSRLPLCPLCPSVCLAAACILVHKQNRSYIAQHALMAFWWCVSGSDFSSLQPQSCSPLNQCPAGGSIKSLSSGGEKQGGRTVKWHWSTLTHGTRNNPPPPIRYFHYISLVLVLASLKFMHLQVMSLATFVKRPWEWFLELGSAVAANSYHSHVSVFQIHGHGL